ncbi:MAG: hypothetical protein HFG40_04700 [Bacilli bacterium]|nr:hypothetical protein [Bacilli bacterium]
MQYFDEKDGQIVKYEVDLNNEKLKAIQEEVQQNYTEIISMFYRGTSIPPEYTKIEIENQKYRYTEIMGGRSERPIYDFQYKWYKQPKIVSIIEQLLAGNIEVIKELEDPKEEKTQREILEEQINLFFPIKASDNLDLLVSLIKEYKEHKHLNSYRWNNLNSKGSILEYYPMVLECIKMKEKEKAKIPKEEIERLISFLPSEEDQLKIRELIEKSKRTKGYEKKIGQQPNSQVKKGV